MTYGIGHQSARPQITNNFVNVNEVYNLKGP